MSGASWDDVHKRLFALQSKALDMIQASPGDAQLISLFRSITECVILVAEIRVQEAPPMPGGKR